MTIDEVVETGWDFKIRPANEYYFVYKNGDLFDASATEPQKVILSVPLTKAPTAR